MEGTGQFENNLAGADLKSTDEDVAFIDELTKLTPQYPATFLGLYDQELTKAKRY